VPGLARSGGVRRAAWARFGGGPADALVHEGTRAVLSKIQEPITLRFYVSKKQLAGLPGIAVPAGLMRQKGRGVPAPIPEGYEPTHQATRRIEAATSPFSRECE